MKRRTKGKRVLAFMLAVTLSVSPAVSMGQVAASGNGNEEMENIPVTETAGDETENTGVTAPAIEEDVEDKDYVVYIEMPEEEETQGSVSENTTGTASGNLTGPEDTDDEDAVSGNTVSENASVQNEVNENQVHKADEDNDENNVIGNSDRTDDTDYHEPAQPATEEIQKSIEEAEKLLKRKMMPRRL